MVYNGEERRRNHIDFSERLGVVEHRVGLLEDYTKENKVLLEEIRETSIKMKTLVGAITFVVSGLWLVLSTFKETIVHWLTGK